VREAQVYSECSRGTRHGKILAIQPMGFILSGGPRSAYEDDAPYIQDFIFKTGLPILGICYGMQALTHALGGQVDPSAKRGIWSGRDRTCDARYDARCDLQGMDVTWRPYHAPAGGVRRAGTQWQQSARGDGRYEAKYFGVQFHPRCITHQMVRNCSNILRLIFCGAKPTWTPASIVDAAVEKIRNQVGDERVLAAVSGGVDSSVASALVHKAIGDQLVAVFVTTVCCARMKGTGRFGISE